MRRGCGRTVCAGGATVAHYRGRSTRTLGAVEALWLKETHVISPIRVGNLTIRYLVDGTESGGLGLFELRSRQARMFRRRTAIRTTKNAFMS
jgi:hypothetical protein